MVKPIKPSPAAVLRSIQKDEQYYNWFKSEVNLVLQRLLGPRTWIQWKGQVDAMAGLLYYSATTLVGLQTLGEEYVRIVQVDGDQLRVPHFIRRLLMVTLQTVTPLLIDRLLKGAEMVLSDEQRPIWPEEANTLEMRTILLELLPSIRRAVNIIHRVHLIAFYFTGNHYELSKRLAGVKYTAIRSWMTSDTSGSLYKVLGTISLVQLVLSVVTSYLQSRQSNDNLEERSEFSLDHSLQDPDGKDVRQVDRCSLCLEKRRHTTSTPCGHLYCWQCIHDWLRSKAQCPICRHQFGPSRLVFLHNY